MEQYLPLIFIPFWFFIIGIISLAGGWNSLSKKYPLSTNFSPSGNLYRGQTLRIGKGTRYNGSINITVCREGILLKPFIFFAFLHKPIYFPFREFNNVSAKKFLFTQYISFSVGAKNLQIYGKAVGEIKTKLISLKIIDRNM